MTTTTNEQRRARVLDDPRFERYRNPRSRWRLAAALVAILGVEAGLFALLDAATWPAIAGLGVVLAAFVFCLGALKASTRGVEELSEGVLDERQWQLRGRVFATAYKIGASLLTVGLAVLALWLNFDLPTPGDGFIIGAIVLPFHIAIVLPTLVAALRDDI